MIRNLKASMNSLLRRSSNRPTSPKTASPPYALTLPPHLAQYGIFRTKEDRSRLPPVARTICWGTHEEAYRLGVGGHGTRKWAYRWIEEHVKSLGKVQTIVDLGGGGIDSILCNILSPYAERVLVVDQGGAGKSRGNIHELVADFEDGVYEIPNDSVEIIVSASSIEHLTKLGQELIFSEIQRILMPGGVFCGTISYVTRLDARALALIIIKAIRLSRRLAALTIVPSTRGTASTIRRG